MYLLVDRKGGEGIQIGIEIQMSLRKEEKRKKQKEVMESEKEVAENDLTL